MLGTGSTNFLLPNCANKAIISLCVTRVRCWTAFTVIPRCILLRKEADPYSGGGPWQRIADLMELTHPDEGMSAAAL
jgi:hypothetical protein